MPANDISRTSNLTVYALGELQRAAVGSVLKSPMNRWRYGGPPVQGLLLIPQDLRTCDPSFAVEIENGYFGLAGIAMRTQGASPFALATPNTAWTRELHGFSWLRHLKAADDEVSQSYALNLFQDWASHYKYCRGIAWQPQVVARRIISWLSHSNLLLDDTDAEQHAIYLQSLTKNIRVLSGSLAQAHDGYPRLLSLVALVLAGLCIDQQDKLIEDNLKRLCFELDRQIDGQGAHISRNPDIGCSLLLDLLPMKQCFSPRHQEIPESILNTIERLLSFLKFIRLGDGALARFNGVSFTKPDILGTVMSYDESVPLKDGATAMSGYIRLQSQSSTLLMDAGELPGLAYSDSAGAGSLAFELSRGIWPIFVNCGAPNATNVNWRLQSRMTSNHNTLTIEDSSSAQLVKTPSLTQSKDRWLLHGPAVTEGKPMTNASEFQVKASHDGYKNKYGIIFERFLSLDESGTVLRGEEVLRIADQKKSGEIKSKWPFKWHFHIHPDVRVMRNENPHQVILELKNGERWLFESEIAADLEESLHLATIREPRKSIRIVLRMANQNNPRTNWILRLVSSGQQVEKSPPS